MTRLQETIEVPRPIEEAFHYTSNFANIEQWDPGVSESFKLTSGPVGVGTSFRVTVSFGPTNTPMEYTVTKYEPPYGIILEGEGGSIQAVDDIRFTEMRGVLNRVGKKAMAGLQTALSQEPEIPTGCWANNLMDRLILPGALGFTLLGYRWRKCSWHPLAVSLTGKTAVITGATAGLGRAAAERLADLGARVIIVGRNRGKAKQARQDIIAATGNENVGLEIADLSLMAQVRTLAQRLLRNEKQIHILVNNAAVLPAKRTLTAEGLETTFATDLLSPFLLTNLLIPRLKDSAPARIVNVSSGGMYLSGIDVDDLQNAEGAYDGSMAYARAKRGLVILTEQWADQLNDSGVVVNAMHPGWADTPGVQDSLPGFYKATKSFLRTPEQGADTIVWLAAASEAGKVSGKFWLDREPHITAVLPGTKGSKAQRQRLWEALT
jgi:NAD(P)-dependent dehydrogenase (short-subunit alcohol dehydrogenase family)